MSDSNIITHDSPLLFSHQVDARPEQDINNMLLSVTRIDNDTSTRNLVHIQQKPTLWGWLLLSWAQMTSGINASSHVNYTTHARENTFSNGMTTLPALSQTSYSLAPSEILAYTNIATGNIKSNIRKKSIENRLLPFSPPLYSAKEIAWINKHTLGDVCCERFPPVVNQVGENKIYKLCGPAQDYQLAVEMNNKLIAIKLVDQITLDMVLAFDPRTPSKTKEIELQDGTWVFSPKTDSVVSTELLLYYKTLKPRGLLNTKIPGRTAFPPDENGLRRYKDNQFVIIRGDNVIVNKKENNLFITLKNNVNHIEIPLMLKNGKLYIDNKNRKKIIGTPHQLSYRVFSKIDSSNLEKLHKTVNAARNIISSVKTMLNNRSPEQLRALIETQLKISYNEGQIKKIKRNISQLDILLNKIINTDSLYRNMALYTAERGTVAINSHLSPHHAAGETDPALRLNKNDIDIYPAFYQEPEMLRIFRMFDIANRYQGGKSLFLFNMDFLEKDHHVEMFTAELVQHQDIKDVIQNCSDQIKQHIAQLTSNTPEHSPLLAGHDTRADLEKRNPKFMQAQYWRYFKEQEISKQDRHGELTLQEYRDGLEKWHMPIAKATDLMRSDRHFIKKALRDSAFLSLITLMLYDQDIAPE